MRNEMETFKLNNIIVSGGNDNKVLFLGEGNFSFSSSLVKTLAMDLSETSCDLSNIWTSCYESDLSKKDINERDEVAAEVKRSNVSYLRSRGCHVLEGVDAEHLEEEPRLSGLSFRRIIFMFPHVGGKMKIHRNRALLLNLISSCRGLLSTGNSELVVTLCRGQGGTPAETVTRPRADTWQLVDMCHEAGCVLTRVELFRADTWPDYSRVGYRGLGKGFHVSGAVVHTMRRRSARPLRCIASLEDVTELQDDPNDDDDDDDGVSLYPPRHIHHLSFWLPAPMTQMEEADVARVVAATGLAEVVTRWESRGGYTHPDTAARSETLEVELCDPRHPLGRTAALAALVNILARSLENCLGVTRR